jgi:nitrogen regulatory protein PII
MKLIKAFVHRNRVADVVQELSNYGFRNLTLMDVKGMLKALSAAELSYSVEVAGSVVTEVQLELVCEDAEVPRVVEIIRSSGRTGQRVAGWIYVSHVEDAIAIDMPPEVTT